MNPPDQQVHLALITGSGAGSIVGLHRLEELRIKTPFGEHAHGLAWVEWQGQRLVHLPRHGDPHTMAPHAINYRANIWALQQLGVTDLFALGAVGGIDPQLLTPGSLVAPDQLIDYTWGRQNTFFDGQFATLQHIDFTNPFDDQLISGLVGAAGRVGLRCRRGGVYGVTQGPRLETAAEIDRLQRDGCHVVGMTAMPEAALARELGLRYALLAVVVNAAAGRGNGSISDEFEQQMAGAVSGALRVVGSAISDQADRSD